MLTGALLVDKPAGPTSHDVVARVRRALGIPRIGHTGTLDPLATGLLVLLIGQATRLAQFLVGDVKEYVADIRLGIETDTYDAEGQPVEAMAMPIARSEIQDAAVASALEAFRGTFQQVPPPHSAKKVAGRRAYEHARRHDPLELAPVEVTVHRLERLEGAEGLVRLRVLCSAGFYVRSLAHDLGRALGCGAHLAALCRTRVGAFSIEEACSLAAIEADGPGAGDRLLPLDRLVGDMPALRLSEEGVRRAGHGNAVSPRHLTQGGLPDPGQPRVRLIDPVGRLVAIAAHGADGLLHPVVVLV
jgi:tRNA pseudouridine55 synthase